MFDPRLLVGYDSSDDACVYSVSDDVAVIETVDFFTPIVDDPYLFGQIAAANALSDVYAMGGVPKLAMNLLCVPSCLPLDTVRAILEGGHDKAVEAGCVIAGGHTIQDDEPKYGLCVTGFVHPQHILKNIGAQPGDVIEVRLYDNGTKVAEGRALSGAPVELNVAEPKLWSPASPFLYDMEVALVRNGRKVDEVQSYTAMRKFSIGRDENDIVRLELNNEPLFQFGPLDQGWWPDGLYTAPSDEALAFDVVKTKELGYNMIRKHVKVEPARWYYHCDKLGMIVWQDMPNGDQGPQWQMHNYFNGAEKHRSAESEANFRKEWKEIIDCLYSVPSIGVWVPFNEAWGQFKAPEIAEWTKAYDPSRLVNPASGGNHYLTGDILDTHHYPHPRMTLLDTNRATVLGEYGGIGLVMKEHLWEPDRNWGYVRLNSPKEVTDEYEKYADMLYKLIGRGFAAAVYTQTTDVEVEVNGLMTYDRKVMKVEPERIRRINERICNALNK